MNSTQIKFLIQLKNAYSIKNQTVLVEKNQTIEKLIPLLYSEGLIQSYSFLKKENLIIIFLRYFVAIPAFKNLKIFSTPSKKVVLQYKDICKINDKQKIFFVSTNKGILGLSECKKNHIGGLLLFAC